MEEINKIKTGNFDYFELFLQKLDKIIELLGGTDTSTDTTESDESLTT